MDFHLKQWRNQLESEQQHYVKIPKLLLEPHQQPSGSALPLFVPELPNSKISFLPAFPDHSISPASRFPRMGSYFSLAQWREFELQTLIFRYIMAGAPVPPELLQPIKKSLLHATTPYFLYQPLQHCPHNYQPALLQSGYWGIASMDPNPGRCHRTDGKKWRCSRDVVAGKKCCERHVNRGRNRSRKPVETPKLSTTTTYACGVGALKAATTAPPLATVAGGSGTHLFSLSGPSPSIDLFHLNQSSSGSKTENKENEISGDGGKSDGNILRHFFDDWPRSLQESHDNAGSNASPMTSSTRSLSISMPGNPSSDVSLKFFTGNGDEPDGRKVCNVEQEQPQLNWATAWATNQVASVEGPLAEALRSSISNSSLNECSSSIAQWFSLRD